MKIVLAIFLSIYISSASADNNWNRIILSGGPHMLIGFVPASLKQSEVINVFIEGDGKPGVALALAKSVGGNSIYIARPCQYMKSIRYDSCSKELWTSHRFSQSVVDSINRAVTVVKTRYKASQVRIIGFSGGGAIASIIASKRSDVALLVTVAGNLDHKLWTDYNKSDPLIGSLNPVNYTSTLFRVPQVHIIGDNDSIMPPGVLASYLINLKRRDKVGVRVVHGADHTCCWTVALAEVLSSN